MDNIDALLEFAEAGGIDLDRIRVMAELALEITDIADELRMKVGNGLCTWIEAQ